MGRELYGCAERRSVLYYITKIFWFAAREKRMRSFDEKVSALNEACKLCGVQPVEPDTAFETFPRQRERIAASIGNLHTAVEYFDALTFF